MASTNKTPNYNLSQYTATDKPTFLVDYNYDMNKIDTEMKNNSNNTTTNTSSIGNIANLNTTNKNNIVEAVNEVNTKVTANTTNIANNTTDINTAKTDISELQTATSQNTTDIATNTTDIATNTTDINKFNLTNIKNYTTPTTSTGITVISCDITVATNSTGTIGKVYGTAKCTGNGNMTIQSDLRPTTNITIKGCNMRVITSNAEIEVPLRIDTTNITISTTGLITIVSGTYTSNSNYCYVNLIGTLLFMKDFGD